MLEAKNVTLLDILKRVVCPLMSVKMISQLFIFIYSMKIKMMQLPKNSNLLV